MKIAESIQIYDQFNTSYQIGWLKLCMYTMYTRGSEYARWHFHTYNIQFIATSTSDNK